jgi:hypothetical protein
MKYYTIKRGRFTFSCTMDSVGVDAWRIYFGGKKDCVTIYVQKNTSICGVAPPHQRIHRNIIFNEHCIDGYTVMMVKTALSFVLTKFKHINAFELIDASYIECVPLNTLYIAKTGKTWYESKFGAYIDNERQREKYHEGIKRLHALPIDDLPNLVENFVKRYRIQMLKMNDRLFQSLLDTLTSKATKHTKMRGLLQEMTSTLDCLAMDKWLAAYLHSIHKFDFNNTLWIIPKSTVTAIDMDIHIDRRKKRIIMDGGCGDDNGPPIYSMDDLKRSNPLPP